MDNSITDAKKVKENPFIKIWVSYSKFIGKTFEDDYADYKNELNQIDLNTEMAYRLYAEPDVVGLSHTETFTVRYDDNGNRQIVFLSGGLSIQYEHYLKNPDEHAIALNSKMIKYEEVSDSVTTPNEITDQTTTAPTTPAEIMGDCNLDGVFSVSDVVLFQKWLTSQDTHLANWKAVDFCEDGKLNVFDF